MNWNDLLSEKRLGGKLEIPYENRKYPMGEKAGISEFEKDYWRIMNYPAFRRLQNKMQICPLNGNDFSSEE